MIEFACSRRSLTFCALLAWVGPRPARADVETLTQLTCLLGTGELGSSDDSAPLNSDESWDFARMSSRRTGHENVLRLASSLARAGYLPGVSTEARLSLDMALDALGGEGPALRDASSYLAIAWHSEGLRLGLRAYPFDSDLWRLGSLHALDWGGTDAARGESSFVEQKGGAPGARLELTWSRASLFSGVKWAWSSASPLGAAERLWGFLSGGSFELSSSWRAELGFGYFERASSFVEGASLRVVWHRGVAEPELAPEPFRPPTLRDEARLLEAEAAPGAALALEGATLLQRVPHVDPPGASELALAPAAALYGSLRGRISAAHGALTWRSAAFVLRHTAGFFPGQTLPASALTLPELAAWVGGSATLLPAHLVPSLEVGCSMPAAFETASSLPGVVQSFVVRDDGKITALPLGAARLPIFAGRVGVRFQASSALGLGAFVTYERDANRSTLKPSPGPARVFAQPDRLQATAAAWARF